MRRLLTGLLGASLLLGACSDDGDDDRAAVTSIPDQTTSTTTTTEKPAVPPPDVIPTDTSLITEEYVEQVLNELLTVSHQALLITMKEGLVGEDVIALVEATTPQDGIADGINELIDLASGGFAGIKSEPRAMTAQVLEVLERQRTCIYAEVVLDDSGLLNEPTSHSGARTFARLTPATEEQRATGLNPTAWTISALPVTLDGSAPTNQC